jgi:hypothetical protein
MLPRALAVSLAALGCVDRRESDPVLLMSRVEDGDGIAVGDADDFAEELRRRCRVAKGDQQCGVNET